MTTWELLLRQYEETPSEWTLVGAMADLAEEEGRGVQAEGLRWVREKRRQPREKTCTARDGRKVVWVPGWSREPEWDFRSWCDHCLWVLSLGEVHRNILWFLPRPLDAWYDKANGGSHWTHDDSSPNQVLLGRLLKAWEGTPAGVREQLWQWVPPTVETGGTRGR